jgi:hypothetical protein
MTEAAALRAFVASKISFSALRNALADSTDFAFLPKGTVSVSFRQSLPCTVFRAKDVQRVLVRYQRGELTIDELTIWGLVLHSLDVFELHGVSEAREEEVWDVITQLSVASINDAFDAVRVSDLLRRLSAVVQRP